MSLDFQRTVGHNIPERRNLSEFMFLTIKHLLYGVYGRRFTCLDTSGFQHKKLRTKKAFMTSRAVSMTLSK
jgi:hypothetical protein